jgi:hypothetical protein
MPLTEAEKPVAQQVHDQLARDFPADAIAWVLKEDVVTWEGPVAIPEDQIDMADRGEWDASHQPGKVAAFRAKLRRRKAKGGHLKPAIFIRAAGSSKDLIADGHHRVLAELAEGQMAWAYVGRVKSAKGPWQTMALSQEPDGKAA